MVENNQTLDVIDHPASSGGCAGCGTGSAVKGLASCGNGLEKIYPTTAVRFGYMRYIGEFSHAEELKFTCGAKVVIQTKRGIELGEQVSLTCNGCDKSVTREEMKRWVEASGEDAYMFDAGRILREATSADLAEFARIQAGCREKQKFAQQISAKHKLPMKVVDCECPLGGERIVFYFTAAERVDFRAMVKELAGEYRTRIEMRQIGARDEARLLADYETCGREVCCKVFLKTLKPISMRMAKLQKATLDPSQVSGRCGRLKCCLRYEHVAYEELQRRLPSMGTRIQTAHGEGVVINRQILTQLIQLRMPDDRIITVVYEDVLKGKLAKPPDEKSEPPNPETNQAEPRRRRPRNRRPDNKPRGETRKDPATGNQPPTEGQSGTAKTEGGRQRRRRRRRGKGDPRSGNEPNPPNS